MITQINPGSSQTPSSDEEEIHANVQAAAPRDRLEGISDSREAPPIQLQTPYAIYPPQPFQGFRDAPNIISPSIYPVETSPGIRRNVLNLRKNISVYFKIRCSTFKTIKVPY